VIVALLVTELIPLRILIAVGRGASGLLESTDRLHPSMVSKSVKTLAEAERAHILAALHEANGVVGGWNGAAAKLGIRSVLVRSMYSARGACARRRCPLTNCHRSRPCS